MHYYRSFLVSTQMVEYPLFCFHANLVFREKRLPICVNAASLPVQKIVLNL